MTTTRGKTAKRITTIANLISHNPSISLSASKNQMSFAGDQRSMEVWAESGFVSHPGYWDIRDGDHRHYGD